MDTHMLPHNQPYFLDFQAFEAYSRMGLDNSNGFTTYSDADRGMQLADFTRFRTSSDGNKHDGRDAEADSTSFAT